jgi:hypothetical protein
MDENLRLVERQLGGEYRIGTNYRGRYGRRYNVGQQWQEGGLSSMQNVRARTGGGDPCTPNWADSPTDAGHGRLTTARPGQVCKPIPPRCDCHVIGINSLGTAGIASNAFGNLAVDAGDADFFIPYYIAVIAFEVNTTTNTLIINPGTPLMVLLQDSRSGQEPNMRRASQTVQSFGVWTLIYGFEKEIECVDWRKFGSQNNQLLTMTFFNPNTVGVHVFVNLWGTAGVPLLV